MKVAVVDRYLSLGTTDDSPEAFRRRARLVNGLATIGVVFLLVFGSTAVARNDLWQAVADYAAALILVGLLVLFWKTGRHDPGAIAGVAIIGVFFFFQLMTGGEDGTGHLWCFTYPVLSTYVLGSRRGLFASAWLLVLASVYFALDEVTPGWADYSLAFQVRFSSSYAIVTMFSLIYEHLRSHTEEALANQTEELRNEIQKRMAAAEELEAATAEATRANEAKSQFLAHMSHELRTPLNHIIGFTELVLSERPGPLAPMQKEYLSDAVSSGRHLLSIINDVLDLSRVEAGKTTVEYSEFDIRVMLQESVRVIQDQAEMKQITYKVATGDLPDRVVLDERMIRQVLYNLLQNAVKFTDLGGTLRLSGDRTPGANDSILITVSDTGIGIEPHNLERVFEGFERPHTERQSGAGGTGLGLALCRHFIQMHGGRIWAESAGPGKGSTFSFELPISPKERDV